MLKKSEKTGKITKKRAKNGQFSRNACLNGHARFKTGDFSTLTTLHDGGGAQPEEQPPQDEGRPPSAGAS